MSSSQVLPSPMALIPQNGAVLQQNKAVSLIIMSCLYRYGLLSSLQYLSDATVMGLACPTDWKSHLNWLNDRHQNFKNGNY